MKNIYIVDSNLDYEKINSFINNSKYSNYMQCPNWAKYRKNKNYFEIVVIESDKIIAYGVAYPLFKYNKRNLYFPRGPILNYDDEKVISLFKIQMKKYFYKNNYDALLIDPAITKELKGFQSKNSNDYFNQQYSSQEAIVDLTKVDSSKDIWESFESKARAYIKIAIKNKIDVTISNTSFNLDRFTFLYNINARLRKFPTKTKEEFEQFLEANQTICAYIQKGEQILNMAIFIKHMDTLYYIFGANDKENDFFHGSYMLHYEMIKYAKTIGAKSYNFGGVFCKIEDKQSKEYGLLRFKKMFTREFKNYIGEIAFE